MNARFREKPFVCPYEVLTTTDYYSHMFKDADDINAETIADIVLRGGKSQSVTDIGGRADEGEAKDCG